MTRMPEKDAYSEPQSARIDAKKDPNLLRVHDKYGREFDIAKEEWLTKVLPETLQAQWNEPDQLYGIIVQSLNDGFRSNIVAAAEQLYKIDPQHMRAACVWGIVLMEEGRLDGAEQIFQDFIAVHGENGLILTNLAKVYAKRGDDRRAEETLWHALELDPNQDSGTGWYYAMHLERGGEASGIEALRRVAALPGSWRAQLALARRALQAHRLEEALALYRQCIDRAAKPVPSDMLMQISGDLGKAHQLQALLQLCTPYFVAETHGLLLGNNLIKAHLDSGQIEAASGIVNALYALERPEYRQTLGFWDMNIAKARLPAPRDTSQSPMQAGMLCFEGPVWLRPESQGNELFPSKESSGISICVLGCTAETADAVPYTYSQLADAPGRMSRALPLFFAEQIDFHSNARVQTLIPWVMQEGTTGFILSGVAWTDEEGSKYARQGPRSDYVVLVHMKCQHEPWTIELRLVHTADGECVGHVNASFPSTEPEQVIPSLVHDLLKILVSQAAIRTRPPSPHYEVPTDTNFPYYLLRLEQLLAVRCSGMDGVRAGVLCGERELIDGNIDLCLACPQNVITRLVLAKTLLAMRKVRPDILPEFRNKVTTLQIEHPLPKPVQDVIQQIINEAGVQ